jgi:hypothetical protein
MLAAKMDVVQLVHPQDMPKADLRANFEATHRFLRDQGYLQELLQSPFAPHSRIVSDLVFDAERDLKGLNEYSIYVIDSFPIAACDNCRIIRSKRYREEVWRGRLHRLHPGRSLPGGAGLFAAPAQVEFEANG